MSALPPKADMVKHRCNVRYVPEADIKISAALVPRLSVGCRVVFISKIRSSPGPTKINHSRGVPSHRSPSKITMPRRDDLHLPFPRVAFVLISFVASREGQIENDLTTASSV